MAEIKATTKELYEIVENSEKDKKGRVHPVCLNIDGVLKVSGDKIELTDEDYKRYGTKNFKKLK